MKQATGSIKSPRKPRRNLRPDQGTRIRRATFESLENRLLLSVAVVENNPGALDDVPALASANLVATPESTFAPDYAASSIVDSGLQAMESAIQTAAAQGQSDFSGLSTQVVHVDAQGRIQVYAVVNTVTPEVFSALETAGLQVETSNADMGIVQGWVPFGSLDGIAQVSGVTQIVPPCYADPQTGAVDAASDGILEASNVRSQFAGYGINGANVKVGVISDGITHAAASQSTGDLPVTITVDPSLQGSGDEGTAMLEIVHDLAPGAQLFFAGPGTTVDMVNSINWMVNTAKVNVIVDDLTFYLASAASSAQPYFSDGSVASAAENAVSQGVVYVSAAGNWQTNSNWQGTQIRSHWEGQFNNDGYGYNNFNTNPGGAVDDGDACNVAAGATIQANLQWSDQWSDNTNEYDLYLVNSNGSELLASSTIRQTGMQPFEDISWTNLTGSVQAVQLVIYQYSGQSRDLDMYVAMSGGNATTSNINSGLYYTAGDSLVDQQAATGVISVGAIDADDSPSYNTIEPYSDWGPSTICTNFSTQTFVARQSLAGCGIDDVDTEVGTLGYFGNPFLGTSAAAPDVAAIAALMHQTNPSLTPAEVATA